jgi:hypothetical protein
MYNVRFVLLKLKKFVLGINKYAVFLRRGGCGSNLFFIRGKQGFNRYSTLKNGDYFPNIRLKNRFANLNTLKYGVNSPPNPRKKGSTPRNIEPSKSKIVQPCVAAS